MLIEGYIGTQLNTNELVLLLMWPVLICMAYLAYTTCIISYLIKYMHDIAELKMPRPIARPRTCSESWSYLACDYVQLVHS